MKIGMFNDNYTYNYDMIASEIKTFIRYTCSKVIDKKWRRSTISLLGARREIVVAFYKQQVRDTIECIPDGYMMGEDFLNLSSEGKFFSLMYFIDAISDTIIELIKNEVFYDEKDYGESIETFLKCSLKSSLRRQRMIIDRIIDIGLEGIDKEFKDDIKKSLIKQIHNKELLIMAVGSKGYDVAKDSEKKKTIWICSFLEEIGILCLSKKIDKPTDEIFHFLVDIVKNYRIKKSNDVLEVTEKIIEKIEELGYKSIYHCLEESSKNMISSLFEIWIENEKDVIIFKDIQEKLQNKEFFNSIIEKYEKELKDEKLVKFQEFKKNSDIVNMTMIYLYTNS